MGTIRIDLTGHKYGMLTVRGLSEERLRGIPSWECVCDCGGARTVAGMDLRNGQTWNCGCTNNLGTPKDITGNRYGKLVATERLGLSGNGDYYWNCQCDCGNIAKATIGNLNSSHTKSCGCDVVANAAQLNKTHSMSKTSEYKSWLKIKERIFDPNCPCFPEYGGAGITLQDSWRDFQTFFDYIGPKPKDGVKYTVDRIDNLKGYEEGNVRWATAEQQARNKTFQRNNTSGFSGVGWDHKFDEKYDNTYAVAQWNTLEGKFRKKHFSVKKYGLLPAFSMACIYREKMIAELNAQGAGYSDKHGK